MNETYLNKYIGYHTTNYLYSIAYNTAITFNFVSNATFHKIISTNLFDIAAI